MVWRFGFLLLRLVSFGLVLSPLLPMPCWNKVMSRKVVGGVGLGVGVGVLVGVGVAVGAIALPKFLSVIEFPLVILRE